MRRFTFLVIVSIHVSAMGAVDLSAYRAQSGLTATANGERPDFAAIDAQHRLLVAAEAWEVHASRWDRWGAELHPKTRELLERGRAADPAEVAAAREAREALRGELAAAMVAAGIDAWVSPAAPGPPPVGLESTGDPVMNLPWTYAGLPALALPAGRDAEGLPLGVQLIGSFVEDETLLAWGRALEEVVGA